MLNMGVQLFTLVDVQGALLLHILSHMLLHRLLHMSSTSMQQDTTPRAARLSMKLQALHLLLYQSHMMQNLPLARYGVLTA